MPPFFAIIMPAHYLMFVVRHRYAMIRSCRWCRFIMIFLPPCRHATPPCCHFSLRYCHDAVRCLRYADIFIAVIITLCHCCCRYYWCWCLPIRLRDVFLTRFRHIMTLRCHIDAAKSAIDADELTMPPLSSLERAIMLPLLYWLFSPLFIISSLAASIIDYYYYLRSITLFSLMKLMLRYWYADAIFITFIITHIICYFADAAASGAAAPCCYYAIRRHLLLIYYWWCWLLVCRALLRRAAAAAWCCYAEYADAATRHITPLITFCFIAPCFRCYAASRLPMLLLRYRFAHAAYYIDASDTLFRWCLRAMPCWCLSLPMLLLMVLIRCFSPHWYAMLMARYCYDIDICRFRDAAKKSALYAAICRRFIYAMMIFMLLSRRCRWWCHAITLFIRRTCYWCLRNISSLRDERRQRCHADAAAAYFHFRFDVADATCCCIMMHDCWYAFDDTPRLPLLCFPRLPRCHFHFERPRWYIICRAMLMRYALLPPIAWSLAGQLAGWRHAIICCHAMPDTALFTWHAITLFAMLAAMTDVTCHAAIMRHAERWFYAII